MSIEYKLIRSDRKTLAIQITPEGVLVRAPKRMNKAEIDRFVLSKQNWIESHLSKMTPRKQAELFTREEIEALAQRALKVIPERVRHYAPLIGVSYGRITIRNQRTRWGSCSGAGNLNFNCLLMLFPPEVLDSVVVHELCHRKHMDHSAAFYAEVKRVLPDYDRCHQWLKDHGGEYLRRMP